MVASFTLLMTLMLTLKKWTYVVLYTFSVLNKCNGRPVVTTVTGWSNIFILARQLSSDIMNQKDIAELRGLEVTGDSN